MFALLEEFRKSTPMLISPKMRELQRKHLKNIKRVKEYWLHSGSAVNGRHPLARALYHFSAISQDPLEIFLIAREQAEGIANNLKFVSGYQYGYCDTEGVFYNSTEEIIYSTEFEESFELVSRYMTEEVPDPRSYLDWKCVSIKRHPCTDLSYHLPTAREMIPSIPARGRNTETCVIHVDLALMYTQYRIWRSRPESLYEDGSRKTIEQFIKGVVLPNCLEDHMDICYLNRFYNTILERDVKTLKPDDRMTLQDIHVEADEIIRFMLYKLLPSSMTIHQLISTIVLPSGRIAYDIYKLPQESILSQNRLALFLPTARCYRFFFTLMKEMEITEKIGNYRNDVKYSNRVFRSNGTLKSIKGVALKPLLFELDWLVGLTA